MRLILSFVAIVALAAVSGCATGVQRLDGEAAPVGSPRQSAVPTALPASASSPPALPSPAGTARQAAERCRTSNLSGEINTFVSAGAAGGRHTAALGFTNIGKVPCTMVGYPDLQLLAFNDQARPTKITRSSDGNTAPVLVTVAPDQRAWTVIAWFFTPSGDELDDIAPCAPEPVAARVTPPDETVSMNIAGNFGPVCAHGEVFVTPMSLTRPQ